MIKALIAGGLGAIVRALGDTFVKPVLAHYQNKDTQFGRMMVTALTVEGQAIVSGNKYRVAMMGTTAGAFLILYTTLPPVTYMNAIILDTLFDGTWAPSIFGWELFSISFDWGVSKLPAGGEAGPFYAYVEKVALAAVGVTGVVGSANIIARRWFNK